MTVPLLLIHVATVVAVTVGLWFAPRVNRDTLPFGVRVPPGRADDPAVTAAVRGYRIAVLAAGLLSLAVAAALWPLLPAQSAMAGSAALLGIGGVGVYLRAHRTVRRAKQRGAWYAGLRQGASVDTALRRDPVATPWWGAAPSLLVIAATAVAGAVLYPGLPEELVISVRYHENGTDLSTAPTTVGSVFGIVFAQVVLTGVLLLVLGLTMRARPELDAARPRASSEQHRRFLVIWARCMMVLMLVQNAALAALAGIVWTGSLAEAGPAAALLIAGPMTAAAGLPVGMALRIGQGGWRLGAPTGEDTGMVQRDDDRFWHVAGLVYANRGDPAFLTPKRTAGLGWTINLGHPLAWLVLGLVAACAAGLAVFVATGTIDGSAHYGWKFE